MFNKFDPKDIIADSVLNQSQQQTRIAQKDFEENRIHRAKVESYLETIVKNTANLNDVVEILNVSNLTQKEIAGVLKSCTEISESKTPEEAEKKYKKVRDEITAWGDNVEATEKLLTVAKNAYNTVEVLAKTYFNNPF